MMITGKSKTIGILGWPVEHSMSPAMHNAAFASTGLDYVYVPLPVSQDNLPKALEGLKAMGFVGANVTIPHKVAVMRHLDVVDRSAEMVGAVNTIVIREGLCYGYNTDAEGFIQSLRNKNIEIAGKKVVLLGAGGAARAVVCGFIDHRAAGVVIGARSADKALDLAAMFSKTAQVIGCGWLTEEFSEALRECDLVVNCTPLGMSPHTNDEPPLNWDNLNSGAVVCDLIYNPLQTKLLKQAARRGHITVSGEGMLAEQGALAFSLWTGKPAPREVMYNILNSVLVNGVG